MRRPRSRIDIREWHNYTIGWKPGNVTFLADGQVVATNAEVPQSGMGVRIMNANRRIQSPFLGESNDFIDIPFDETIQVDHIRVLGVPEAALLCLLGLILLPATLQRVES